MKPSSRPPASTFAAAFCCVLVLALSIGFAAPARAGEPSAVVEGFHASLLEAMKNADSLGPEGRYRHLQAPLDAAFDLIRMIRIASGALWKSADDDARTRLLGAFRRMSLATYASQFDGFSGETFTTVDERPGPQGTVLVATRIDSPGDDGADLTYVTIESGGRWLITDVLLDNTISQLAVRRSEYRQVLKEKGIAGLTRVLGDKADALLKK